jgi:hypothetical protein
MKFVKTANGKTKVTMSRKEWETIGRIAGWGKLSPSDYEAEFLQNQLILHPQRTLNYIYDKYTGNYLALFKKMDWEKILNNIKKDQVNVDVLKRIHGGVPSEERGKLVDLWINLLMQNTYYVREVPSDLVEMIQKRPEGDYLMGKSQALQEKTIEK